MIACDRPGPTLRRGLGRPSAVDHQTGTRPLRDHGAHARRSGFDEPALRRSCSWGGPRATYGAVRSVAVRSRSLLRSLVLRGCNHPLSKRESVRNLSPSLPACFLNENNAPKSLILPLSRRRIIRPPRGDGEGAKACDLRGLGGRSSGRARRRRSREGPRPSSSGAGRARNTDTALTKGPAGAAGMG